MLPDEKMTAPDHPCAMPTLFKSLRGALVASLVLILFSGCAVNHSDNFVSLVMTEEVGPSTVPLSSVEIVVGGGRFGEITTKGKAAPGLEMIANRQLGTLLPALRLQLPGVLRRNGIVAQAVRGDTPPTADNVVTVKPLRATETSGNGYSAQNGNSVGLTLAIEIRRRTGEIVWRGTALERASTSRPESMQWSDAMAEDLARTLLIRLRKEGIVKLGAGGDVDPI